MYCTRKVTEDLTWVGADDRRLACFEGVYGVPDGVSYNAYLLNDEKTVLFDTVDKAVSRTFFENLAHALGGRQLDYLVISHMEPDHAATIEELTLRHPEVTIVCNAKIKTMLGQFFTLSDTLRYHIVAEGDKLSTGRHEFHLRHGSPWSTGPEVMMTYDACDKVLFSADGFGKFGALDAQEDWDCEARRYYFNIVGKYGPQVQSVLKKAAGLDIQVICPLHGPVLKENLQHYLEKYSIWSSYGVESQGVFIACASIHGNTAAAMEKLAELLRGRGCPAVVTADLTRCDMAEALEDAFRYGKVVLAASSYNAGVMPAMEDFLHHLKGKNYQKRTVALVENGLLGPLRRPLHERTALPNEGHHPGRAGPHPSRRPEGRRPPRTGSTGRRIDLSLSQQKRQAVRRVLIRQ